jgi:CheY-like chemotaxis protein
MNKKNHGLKLLLVEPNQQAQTARHAMIIQALDRQDIVINTAYTGEEALSLFQIYKPYDFILLPTTLPDISIQFVIAAMRYFNVYECYYSPPAFFIFEDETDHSKPDITLHDKEPDVVLLQSVTVDDLRKFFKNIF